MFFCRPGVDERYQYPKQGYSDMVYQSVNQVFAVYLQVRLLWGTVLATLPKSGIGGFIPPKYTFYPQIDVTLVNKL